jgi:hypothetical protein
VQSKARYMLQTQADACVPAVTYKFMPQNCAAAVQAVVG